MTKDQENARGLKNGQAIARERKLKMFDYWCQGHTITQTAKHFNHSRTTIQRMKSADLWDKRRDEIQKNLTDKHDKKTEQRIASNLDYVTAVKNKILKRILAKDFVVKASIKDLVMVMEYEDKLLGNLPTETKPGGSIINVFTAMQPNEQDATISDAETILATLRCKNRL